MDINRELYHYKLINKTTNDVECYVSLDLPIKEEKVCDVLCLDGFFAIAITKEEYEAEAEVATR